jgi:phage tail-like protein
MGARDPGISFQYKIQLDTVIGYFTECSGLGSETDVVEHKIQKDNVDLVQMVPGRLKWDRVKLKRGITDNMDFWDWRKMVEDGDVAGARQNGTISMLDQEGNVLAEWEFIQAWPTKVSGPDLKADSNAFGIEEITIAHEGIWRKK